MLRLLQDKKIQYLLLAALAVRLIAALTYLRPTHPDEINQGIELAHLIRTGLGTDVIEILFHLRNLTLSFSFIAVHSILAFLDLDNPYWRLVGPRCLVAFLDMGIVWAVYRKLQEKGEPSQTLVLNMLMVFAFASFCVRDAPSTTLEHCSAVFMWLAVGFAARAAEPRQLFYAGFCAVMVGVMRYPSALFSFGFFVAILCRYCTDPTMKKQPVKASLLGALLAFLVGGLADWVVYGRPYESFWMYLQFNVLSGLGAQKFGATTLWVYTSMFVSRFGYELSVLSLIALPFAMRRFGNDLRRFDVMAWGILLYGVGHCFPAHKEIRFMIPLSSFTLWYLVMGLYDLWCSQSFVMRWLQERRKLCLGFVVIVALIPNAIRLFIVLRGDFAKVRLTYFSVVNEAWPDDVCAVVTSVPFPSMAFPSEPKLMGIQELRQEDVFSKEHLKTVTWQRSPAECFNEGKSVFVIHEKISTALKASHCAPAMGLNLYTKLVGLVSDKTIVWKCSLRGLANETPSVADRRVNLKTKFPHLSQLPPLGMNAQSLDEFVKVVAE